MEPPFVNLQTDQIEFREHMICSETPTETIS